MLFRKPPPIYDQIDEYVSWKAEKYPLVAGGHRSLLRRFAKSHNIYSIETIEPHELAFFIGEELTAFYGEEARKALKSFLWYGKMAGYKCVSHDMTDKQNIVLPRMGRPVQWNMVREIKDIREHNPMAGARTIAGILTKRHNRKIAKSSVERWTSRIPDLEGEGSTA